jgi:HSP20 family protein
MADVKVETQQGRQPTGTAVARRGERDAYSMNPFTIMRRLSEEMDRAFATSFGLPSWGTAGTAEAAWTPAVEVTERDNNLVINADLPGLNKDDIKLEVNDEGLVIQGERRREREERHRGYYRSERSYGSFYRTVPLPQGIDAEKARAQFKDGVLQVEFPIPESMQRRRREIPIKT